MYKFATFKPHPNNPISIEAFDRFDQTIAEINSDLGISQNDNFYAISSASGESPEITVTRHEGPDDLRTLTIGTVALGLATDFMSRNDCGTRFRPRQVAASATVRRENSLIVDEERNVPEDEFTDLHELVSRRAKDRLFVKKRSVLLIPTIFSVA